MGMGNVDLQNVNLENLIKEVMVQMKEETARKNSGQAPAACNFAGNGATNQAGIFSDVNAAIEAAHQAQKQLFRMTLADRKRITDTIR